jgi:hypothetical protein
LGGVLPPNKKVLPDCTEKVNDYWCKIKPNTYFSRELSPSFHFCAYSYILTKKGAQKIINYFNNSESKAFTLNDHLLSSPNIGLTKYFINPFLTYCFQEEDPTYLNSEFNNLHRQDTFDSDIWNNSECFTDEELLPFSAPLNNKKKDTVIYYLGDNEPNLYEHKWLKDILPSYSFKKLTGDFNENGAWFLVQRPHIDNLSTFFSGLTIRSIDFKVLHLSDEFGTDNIDFYSYPNCKAVIRNYWRDGVSASHIITIPLGYHHFGNNNRPFTERKLVWSFQGTDWFNRRKTLEGIYDLLPHSCHFTDNFNSPKMTSETQYLSTLSNTKFCPVMRGNNIETFRMYEALETGVIPIYVRQANDEMYWSVISSKLGLKEIHNWLEAKEFINKLNTNMDDAEEYRMKLYNNWLTWKNEIRGECFKLF